MEVNKSLKTLYKEQLDLYPKLSQEEIVALYESEGITNETVDEALSRFTFLISEKKEKLSLLTNENDEERLLCAIFGENNPEQEKIRNLKKKINNLEKKAEEIQALHQEMLDLLPSVDLADKSIESTIEQLNREIVKRKQQIETEIDGDSLNNLKFKKINVLQLELEQFEEKANKLKRTYKNYAHKFYISTRGIMPRDRKFPSKEIRNKIVCGTLGLAKYWARVYYYKVENTIPFDDLNQIANEALMSAAHYYIPSDRAKFTTYVSKCIENKLKREIYDRRKLKKRPCKPEEFFQKEQDKVKYIKMFLEALKTESRSRKTRYYSEKYVESISVTLFRFKEEIRYHNWEMKMREETNRLLPSFSGKRTEEKFDIIVQRIINMINESKMKTLITNEDRQLANMLVNYQMKSKDTQEIYQLINYLDNYSYKLDLIEQFLTIQERLIAENDGITPTDMEILKELNKKIKLDNQKRSQLKKQGMFDKQPFYQYYHNYYTVYKELFNVDPFIRSEDDEYEGIMNKQKERAIITYNYWNGDDERLDKLDDMINSIDYIECNKVVLYFSTDKSQIYDDWAEFEEDEQYENCDILSKEEALERLNIVRKTIELTEEEYVKMVLQQRKDEANKILREKNAPIVEYNRKVTKLRDDYALGAKYQKYLKENQITDIKKDIELFYNDDSELFILMNSGRSKNKFHNLNLSVEEEALNNVFLEDYYEALNNLSDLEKQVLLKYFDENGVHSKKAKEIGTELEITQGEVYKIKTKALKKLSRNPILQNYNEE